MEEGPADQGMVSRQQGVQVHWDDRPCIQRSQGWVVVGYIDDGHLAPSRRIVMTRLGPRSQLGIQVRELGVVEGWTGAHRGSVIFDIPLSPDSALNPRVWEGGRFSLQVWERCCSPYSEPPDTSCW